MKAVLYLSVVVLLAVCATWAYRVNYATQGALNRIDDLRGEIAEETEALGVLRAEWAYLNRPDRLRELVAANAEALGLVELSPEQFGEVSEAPFPPPPPPAPEDAAPEEPEGATQGAARRPSGHAALVPNPVNGAIE